MPSTITELAILENMKARYEGISIANGYYTNLGSRVFLMRQDAFQPSELPCLNIRVLRTRYDEELVRTQQNFHQQQMETETMMLFEAGTMPVETIIKGLADINRAIGVDDTWGGKAITTNPIEHVIVVERESDDARTLERTVGGAIVAASVLFRTRKYAEQ